MAVSETPLAAMLIGLRYHAGDNVLDLGFRLGFGGVVLSFQTTATRKGLEVE